MWRTITLRCVWPKARAARTNCCSRNDSVMPRITRAMLAQPMKLKMMMIIA